jgi:uncharacterized membrane protein YphA (DoxX/SURF4 family)
VGDYWSNKVPIAIRSLDLSPFQRVTYTKTAVVSGFVAGFLLSRRLWVSYRFFPLIPILPGLPHIPTLVDGILFAVLLVLLALIGVATRPRIYILSFALFLLFLALFDQTRWQPWAYLYLFMLLGLACFSWKPDDVAGQENALNICRLIVCATYFYSGLQKMNPRFMVGTTSMFGALSSRWPALHALGWIMAGTETLIAIGLLTRKFRNVAVIAGVLMHLDILYVCVIILHWNSVIWPWNVAMMALLFLLFWETDFSFRQVVWANPFRLQKVVLVLFAVLPLLSFFGWWDSYLSASLYSANIPMAYIWMSPAVKRQLPLQIQRYVKKQPGGNDLLKVQDWALGELNVPPYPAVRAYRTIGAALCHYSHNSPDISLVIHEKDTLLQQGPSLPDTCLGTLLVNKW